MGAGAASQAEGRGSIPVVSTTPAGCANQRIRPLCRAILGRRGRRTANKNPYVCGRPGRVGEPVAESGRFGSETVSDWRRDVVRRPLRARDRRACHQAPKRGAMQAADTRLEPSTFCMASSASAEASRSETERNRALRLGFRRLAPPRSANGRGANPRTFVPLLCHGPTPPRSTVPHSTRSIVPAGRESR